MKKNKLNKILNISIIFLSFIAFFAYQQVGNFTQASLLGHENAGGKIIKPTVSECSCDPVGGIVFISTGKNGGTYIDSSTTKHYKRGKVSRSTKWHISKTTMTVPCTVICPTGCCPHPRTPQGRLLLFGGTNKGGGI